MKEDAEIHLKQKVQKVVLTVPIFYDEEQRQEAKDLATEAGLEVLELMDEPKAAAMAYGLEKLGNDKVIAVLDIGARTFDVTILKPTGKGDFEVVKTGTDHQLGGDDFDQLVLNNFLKKLYDRARDYDLTNP